jgi:DNA-binding MarR family transcriptional regulator
MPASDAPAAGPSEGPRSEGEGDGQHREFPSRTPELTRSDERVLAYLRDAGTDYPAFVASNTGLYADHVESRLDALETAGLVERVTGETVYRITDDGRDALRDDCAAWSD